MPKTALSIDSINAKAKALAAEIHANDPELTLVFLVHRDGQLQSTFHVAEDMFLHHPAGRIASTIAHKNFLPHEPSMFHGLCMKQKSGLFGMDPETVYLAIISINADSYQSEEDAYTDLYRQTWYALELVTLTRTNPPEKIPDRPLNIKRNVIGETRINLRADLFAVLFMHADGHDNAIQRIAGARAMSVLTRSVHTNPNLFILPMLAQATRFAQENVMPQMDREKPRLKRITQVTLELANSMTDDQIKLWHRLCDLSQEMAWTGVAPGAIVGAAVHTSDDAYLRSVMHTIADLATVEPLDLDAIRTLYNPHLGVEGNRPTHDALIDYYFERDLRGSLAKSSPRPLLERAEAQNLELMHGRFMGWCANALQGAAHVLGRSDNPNISPAQAARIEFEGQSRLPTLAVLHRFAGEITAKRKAGETLTLERLVDLARDSSDLELVARSIEYTIAHRFHDTTTVSSSTQDDDVSGDLDLAINIPIPGTITSEDGHGSKRTHTADGTPPPTPSEFTLEE